MPDVCGEQPDFDGPRTAGLTDSVVLALETAGCDAGPDTAEWALRAYKRHLPACLHRRRGRVLPGVREVIEPLPGEARIASCYSPATPQLRPSRSSPTTDSIHTSRPGGFCEGPGSREEIATRGLVRAAEFLGSPDSERIEVIGDMPGDIQRGVAIGAPTVAVATGSYTTRRWPPRWRTTTPCCWSSRCRSRRGFPRSLALP